MNTETAPAAPRRLGSMNPDSAAAVRMTSATLAVALEFLAPLPSHSAAIARGRALQESAESAARDARGAGYAHLLLAGLSLALRHGQPERVAAVLESAPAHLPPPADCESGVRMNATAARVAAAEKRVRDALHRANRAGTPARQRVAIAAATLAARRYAAIRFAIARRAEAEANAAWNAAAAAAEAEPKGQAARYAATVAAAAVCPGCALES